MAEKYVSHPLQRRLPQPSQRPLATGLAYFVDAVKGDDAAAGDKSTPWRTVAHAIAQLKAGDTLYLRGGTYYGTLKIEELAGQENKPITIRSYPGEMAIIDSGIREFYDAPQTVWEPFAGGAPDEFRSTKPYPVLKTEGRRGVTVLGRLAHDMMPLHGYKTEFDLRSDNQYGNVSKNSKSDAEDNQYVGPGVWFDHDTERLQSGRPIRAS